MLQLGECKVERQVEIQFCYSASQLQNSNAILLDLRFIKDKHFSSDSIKQQVQAIIVETSKKIQVVSTISLSTSASKNIQTPSSSNTAQSLVYRTTSVKLHHHHLKANVDLILQMNSRVDSRSH